MKLYEILKVSPSATPEEIKKAYRALAMEHHPDKGGDAATMGRISAAYEILSDPEKRQRYDNGESPEVINRPHDAFQGEVLQSLVQIFLMTVANSNPEVTDIFLNMKSSIKATQIQIDREIKVEDHKIAKFEKVKSRISTDKEDNLFASVLNQQVAECNRIKEKLQHQKKVGTAMLEFIEDYKYKTEEAIMMLSSHNVTFSFTTTNP